MYEFVGLECVEPDHTTLSFLGIANVIEKGPQMVAWFHETLMDPKKTSTPKLGRRARQTTWAA